jgi:hypothetical protein
MLPSCCRQPHRPTRHAPRSRCHTQTLAGTAALKLDNSAACKHLKHTTVQPCPPHLLPELRQRACHEAARVDPVMCVDRVLHVAHVLAALDQRHAPLQAGLVAGQLQQPRALACRARARGRGVRCGAVWCGVVWCGVVWCGVVWCGVVWCGVVWCGVSVHVVVWCMMQPDQLCQGRLCLLVLPAAVPGAGPQVHATTEAQQLLQLLRKPTCKHGAHHKVYAAGGEGCCWRWRRAGLHAWRCCWRVTQDAVLVAERQQV